MTDRVKGFTVTLEREIRIDDVQGIINAIKMIKGIANVEPSIENVDDSINRHMIKYQLREKFLKFYYDELT